MFHSFATKKASTPAAVCANEGKYAPGQRILVSVQLPRYREILMFAQEQTDMKGAALTRMNVFILFIVPVTNAGNVASAKPAV